jgi:hypothetical protein
MLRVASVSHGRYSVIASPTTRQASRDIPQEPQDSVRQHASPWHARKGVRRQAGLVEKERPKG